MCMPPLISMEIDKQEVVRLRKKWYLGCDNIFGVK